MIQGLYGVEEVSQMILAGNTMFLAGGEKALAKLPAGKWIAGTTTYFMPDAKEKVISQELVFVHQLPDYVTGVEIKEYDAASIKNIYTEAPDNGFTMLILPGNSDVMFEYAIHAPYYDKFASSPVCGWISGLSSEGLATKPSFSISGSKPAFYNNKAVAMHVSLPQHKYAEINIFSPFKDKPGITITFDYDGWTQDEAIINGVKQNLAAYMVENKLNPTYPLIANYASAQICVSYLKTLGNKVYSYAPVFKGIEYHLSELDSQARDLQLSGEVIYSMSCILNFQHPELCEKYLGKMCGPVTFGEIAYQLVNQTTVYLTIGNV